MELRARFDDLVATELSGAPLRRLNHGAYLLAEQSAWAAADASGRDLALFFRHGAASPDVNRFAASTSLGLRFKGMLPGRAEDVFGLATTRARNSAKFVFVAAPQSATETMIEATYRVQLKPWLALQPVLQRILKPNTDPALTNAWVAGMRMEVVL